MSTNHGFQATIRARDGKSDELIQLLLSGTPTSNPDCVLYLVCRSVDDPSVIHVMEGWTTRDAHAEHFAREETKALVAKIGPLLVDAARYQDVVPVGGIVRG
ncbi:putative quinol monooxygenase [Polyangium mundeleinium]|uniref:Antibiotic biosynthesis monooxygenase n=1 Tax=Polyangium mundeleinium TaxID=2995306 RepID=A0ABT5EIL1_9BACT|nr:antibiotic biosynthesis monooxygenase [Polyangium mundeleinium]MDC0741649.1 antibiotic biosynthesis monooxygenase [Polyangium mundeleinium]